MGYRFIAVIAREQQTGPLPFGEDQSAFLRGQGLDRAFPCGPLTVFASPTTPVSTVPGGAIIGHLFRRDGEAVEPGRFADALGTPALGSILLSEYWGEYVLLQAGSDVGADLAALRDPSGGVPCLYAFKDGSGFVTSDLSLARGLGLHDGSIDWDYISQAVAYPHLTTSRTGIAGVEELLPGSALTVSDGQVDTREAWSPWTFVDGAHRFGDERTATMDIRSSVEAAVKAWARTDRSVLVELSGGLDSSIVAMCLRGSPEFVGCCTMLTPVPGADERHYARQVAGALGAELAEEMLTFDEARHDFELEVDTARPRMSVLQHVTNRAAISVAKRHGFSSFFSGGGGDTIFSYLQGATPAADAWRAHGIRAGMSAVLDLSRLHQCTYWTAARLTLRKLWKGAKPPSRPDTSLLSRSFEAPRVNHPWFSAPQGALAGDRERIADLAWTQAFRESAPRSATHWLRLPLLSQPVVETCLKAPSWMWIAGGQNRALARSAFADLLPPDVLERRSKGNFMNYFGAIYQRNRHRIQDYLVGGELQAAGLLDEKAIVRFIRTPLAPRDTSFTRVFDLCMIENWLRHQGARR